VVCLNRHLPLKKTFQPFKKDLGSKLEYLSRTKLLMPIVRKDGFKLERGELFKEGFHKLLSQE